MVFFLTSEDFVKFVYITDVDMAFTKLGIAVVTDDNINLGMRYVRFHELLRVLRGNEYHLFW